LHNARCILGVEHEIWRFSAQKREKAIAHRRIRRYIATARPQGQILERRNKTQWQQAQ
jgi:hypothetical protein